MKKQKTVLHLKKFRIANLNRFFIQGGINQLTDPNPLTETVDSNTNPFITYENGTSCNGAGGYDSTCGTEGNPRSLNVACGVNGTEVNGGGMLGTQNNC